MRNLFNSLILLNLFFSYICVYGDEYQLVWSDEFNLDGKPDPSKWTYEEGFVRNRELQWYQAQNAVCKDGKLIITAHKETKSNPHYIQNSKDWTKNRKKIEITSACLITRGLHSWKYGRFEIRARIPTGKGIWPAIWTLGVEGEWPSNGEIDIMEYYKGKILANFFWGTEQRWKPVINSQTKNLTDFKSNTWADQFHVWRMDWTDSSIKIFIDDELIHHVDPRYIKNPTNKFGPSSPFHQPHYLLINLAIGGNAAGPPDINLLPTKYEVDYVRIYQKK